MLFDERKMPYHLMLQYFVGTGAHSALFECFKWALSSEFDEKKEPADTPANELPGSVDDFLEAWLMLLERLVNPRNILNSPHTIHERPSALNPPDAPPPIKAPFSAVKFLIKTQKAALEALQHLWSSGRLSHLSSRICDSVILILCHLIRGEQFAREKLKEEQDEAEKKAKSGGSSSHDPSALADYYFEALASRSRASTLTAARTNQPAGNSRAPEIVTVRTTRRPDPTVVQQLMDMGFPRENCVEALSFANTLEGATEWLLTHSSEEDQLIRAITMSLENNGATSTEDATQPNVEEVTETTSSNEQPGETKADANVEQTEKPETSEPTEPSQEEIDKKAELEATLRSDKEELSLLSQDDEEPMSSSDIDDFAASIFEGSLQLVNQLPDTVYRVCDVIVVLMKRAGREWSDGVFEKLVSQIKEICQKLLNDYSNNADNVWLNDDQSTEGLATKALLFALLFEEMKESCTRIVSESQLITTIVSLLSAAATWVQKNSLKTKDVATPKWISPVVLLTDLYERTRVSLICRQELNRKYSGQKREWKWFDDRSGRWCSYSTGNHKSIDDAYIAGSQSVRFTAGRRKYTINFNQLIQFNEESGNRRPIMATYQKETSSKGKAEPERKIAKPDPTSVSEERMETDADSGNKTIPASSSQSSSGVDTHAFLPLGDSEVDSLVASCTAYVCLPVDADTLHSCMRLLLRLTRTGTEGGHRRAMLFAELGGASALLKLRNHHGFIGFASLATLLLRHILEDNETLKITMDKTIRGISTTGAGNASCGVNSGSMGSRELHYVLRALAPAACQHPNLFSTACRDNLRILLPPTTCRNIESEEATLAGPNGIQFLKPSTKLEQLQHSNFLPPVVMDTIKQLLDALVATKPTPPSNSSSTAPKDLPAGQTSTTTSELPPHEAIASDNKTKSDQKPATKEQTKPTGDELLVTKSSILRLLAELVRSYPSCASLVATHHYKAGMSSLVQQDCSALSFILDHLLIPRTKPRENATANLTTTPTTSASTTASNNTSQSQESNADGHWDKDCPALARLLLACLAASHPTSATSNSEAHVTLVSELKSSLARAVHITESPEKHVKLRSLLDMTATIIECTSKPSQQNRRPLGRQQPQQESQSDQSTGHIPKLMIRRGLASDLAKVPHFIDLGSGEMAETVNAALRPLEILTRWTSLSSAAVKQQASEDKKATTSSNTSTSHTQTPPQSTTDDARGDTNEEDWMNIVNREVPSESHDDADRGDTNEMSDDEYLDVIPGDRASQESDLQYLDASENQPSATQEDVFMEPIASRNEDDEDVSDVDVVVLGTRIESTTGTEQEHSDHDDETGADLDEVDDAVSQDEDDDIADDTINGDDTSDDSDQDDDDDDDEDDTDNLDEEGSEMGNHDMEDDDVDGYDDLNYDTFLYDLMQGDQQDNDLFIHLEDIFGGMPGPRMPQQLLPMTEARRIALPVVVHGEDARNNLQTSHTIPAPPGTVATCHPLLVRHANHAQVTDSSAAVVSAPRGQAFGQSFLNMAPGNHNAADGWSHRVMRSGAGNTVSRARAETDAPNHTIHLRYTGNSQPRSAPMVLQRLLGPSVAQDILQISNSLYSEGGGRAQVVVNADELNHASDDIIDGMFLDSMFQYQSGLTHPTAAMVPDNVPSSLARWVEECCVLDAHSLYDRMALVKDEIVGHVLKIRDQELAERKDKRKKEKEKQKEEEDKRKKEKEEKEKLEKEKKEKESQESTSEVSVTVATEQTDGSTPKISTPSNTPVATRPDSPTVTSTAERPPAINALQQASSSLLAVSGQLEGLSFSLQQVRGQQDDATPTEADTTEQLADGNAESTGENVPDSTSELQLPSNVQRETSPVVMDTTSPASNRSDVTMETNEAEEGGDEATGGGAEEQASSDNTTEPISFGIDAADAADAADPADAEGGQIMEGVDPSFLAALPADIRQEVIREQLSRSHHRAPTSTTVASGTQAASGVSPEFLAALPPNIQEEVLEQERRERSRNAAPTSGDESVDPTTFIQTLPADLRQSVLSDMDESLVAVLSEELAAEAQTLRGDAEERQRRYLQERLRGDLFRQGGPPRVRHRATHDDGNTSWGGFGSFSGGLRRRPAYANRQGASSQNQSQTPMSRQILDHESLACLLLLLFVEETRMNTSVLHRVFRNLCYHSPTRDWLVSTLMSILQRAGEVCPVTKPHPDNSAMEVTPSSPPKMQKQFQKKQTMWSGDGGSYPNRNTSWMSIRLEAALGSRSSIFQVETDPQPPSSPPTRKGHHTTKESSNVDVANKHVFIHPQAAPVVCRHAIDALIVLSKIFPTYFVTSQSLKQSKVITDKNTEQGPQVESDFWDMLMRLDAMSVHKKKTSRHGHSNEEEASTSSKANTDPATFDLSGTWLGVLMRMLCHPVVKRSQQLTDRMLRLLAQVSRNISAASGLSKSADKNKADASSSGGTSTTNTTDSTATTDAQAQQTADSENSEAGANEEGEDANSSTATMSARAGTSNTSTIGRSALISLTSTTSSSRSHGSISTISEAPANSRDEKHNNMEKELSLAVSVLTSHACSEEGLEDATSLLLQLSKSAPPLRLLIIRLLLEGAQKLGGLLGDQIKTLLEEIIVYNQQQLDSGASPSTSAAPIKGSMLSRFDSTLTVVLSAKDKFKKLGRELQLPSMQVLTSKTSRQAFFLRILKVIIQLQQASRGHPISELTSHSRLGNQFRWRGAGMLSAMRNTVSQLEREADALMDIIAPPLSRLSRNPMERSSNPAAASSSSQQEIEAEGEADETGLSERLQLEELWDVLGACLKELSKSHDQHAVLVLQPAVESFFLVHASETSQSIARRNATATEPESRESQLAHIHEQQPVSPGQPAGATSESKASLSSQSSLVDASMPLDTQKFLRFAETHRTVLNQILRQSTIPLSEGPFSVLVDHTRVLDFDVKRRYFRQELERTEDSSMRRDDVAIRVRRDHLFEDSFRELHRRTPAELRSRLYVVFDGEDGQDAGGVLREWYLVISREIFNPMYVLFRTSPGDHGTYAINPLSYVNSNHLSYFKFVGRIVAKAIYDNKLLECYFTRSFYKHILGKPVKYTDMEAEDYEFSQGLLYLLEHDISALCTELNFSVEIEEFGKTETRDLKEDGRNLMVTERNKREYVHLVCQEKMTGAIKKQLAAFLEGFYEIIPKRLISIFDEQELELLISGLPNIDIDDLRQNTEYHKYQTNSLQVQWFWRALRSFDQAERAKFLQFVTGTSKVPLQGFAALEGMTGTQKFQIHRDDRSTSRLPCAHTCFNQLDLPAYETFDKLRERLLLAISECTEGFGLA